ncbi:MAG TPA: outer membrane beta-barrel protein [Nevskiaceae bacterium]|nr:outer membrane beta-barrel protein [Nevskiaceae bacterium]
MIRLIAVVAACLFCSAAWSAGFVDLRYAGGSYEFNDEDSDDKLEIEDVDGFEGRVHLDVSQAIFLRGSYLDASGDEVEANDIEVDADVESRIGRLGGGYQFAAKPFLVGFSVEYVDLKIEIEDEAFSDDGGMITAGLRDHGTRKLFWYAEVGTVLMQDMSGAEVDAAIGYRFTPQVAAFFGTQAYHLEDDDDVEVDVVHVALGVRFTF